MAEKTNSFTLHRTRHTCISLYVLPLVLIGLITSICAESDSPREQQSRGILPKDVMCNAGLDLVFKSTGGEAVCVKPSTAQRLEEQGWAKNQLSQSTSLAFFLNTRSPYYDQNLNTLAKNLKQGDSIFILVNTKPDQSDILVQQAKSICKEGVNVYSALLYSKLENIVNDSMPKNADWVVYDYENGTGFSPEFTVNQTKSQQYFDQAKDAVERYNQKTSSNAKLMITPPYGELLPGNWNWGLAAKHADAIDVQTQRFVKSDTFKDMISNMSDQIQKESPGKFFMVQFSLRPSVGTVSQTVSAMQNIQNVKVDAFLVFYDQFSQNTQLEDFFATLDRY